MLGPGKSSASQWTPFASVSTAVVRKLKARCYVAWTRVQDVSSFAIVGTSVVGGTDIIQGVGDTVLGSADLYNYFDETARVIRLEYERHLIEPLGGIAVAVADIVLDNTDLRFTPNYNSTIGTALKPNRPVKMFIGFEVEDQEMLIQIIEGVSLQPKENKLNRTVSIQVLDFLQILNQKPQETAIYTEQRSDQIIADILARAGVGSTSYSLDQGLNTIGFAWFEKGQTAGDRIRKICEAEEAIFYQDEEGIFRFENRDKFMEAPYNSAVWTIEKDDILEWNQQLNTKIINRALVKGAPRSVKGESEIWHDGIEEEIPAGGSLTVWAQFEEPVSSITNPSTNFDYKAYTATAAGGSDITADISFVITSFTKTAKIVISNANVAPAFLFLFRLRGTPASIDYEIREVFQDDTSIDSFNEYQQEVKNEFIDKKAFAKNMAQDLVRRHKDPLGVLQLRIRGIPQLQLKDQIKVKDMDLDTYSNYRLIGIQGVFEGGAFTQTLTLREITTNEVL